MKMEDKWNEPWSLDEHFISLFSSNALEVSSSKVIFSTTSSLHLFLADGGYKLSPWQNIKRWFSECVHGVLVTRSVYLPACFMCVQLAVFVIHVCMCAYFLLFMCVCLCVRACVYVCVCVRAWDTAVITYSSLHFKYAVTVHFNVLHTVAQTHKEIERDGWKHFSFVNKTIPVNCNG